MKFATKAIHVGQDPDPTTGATIVPIYQTSTYTQTRVGEHRGFDYSRTINPTRLALERQLASLEGARYGSAFASGMAATSAVLGLLSAGDHVVVCDDLYGGTYRLFTRVLERYSLHFDFVDMTDPDAVARGGQADDETLLDRDADESAAEARRHRGHRRDCARLPWRRSRAKSGRRQTIRSQRRIFNSPSRSGADRRPFDDEVHRRPQRRHRRRRDHRRRVAPRSNSLHPELGRRRSRTARRLADDARRKDARAAHARARAQRANRGGVSWTRATTSRASIIRACRRTRSTRLPSAR